MGAALKIYETWPNFRPLLASGLAGFANDDVRVASAADKRELVTRIERQLEQARRWSAEKLSQARSAIPDGGPSDIDETIELLEREEGALVREFGPQIKKARRLIGNVRPSSRDSVKKVARDLAEGVDWLENIIVQHEELLRDLRWQLMAVRAEARKDQTGPVFDDPASLRHYLRSR